LQKAHINRTRRQTVAGRRHLRASQKQPNSWQLRDMLGNLYEWVEDFSGYIGFRVALRLADAEAAPAN
jgi:formylglycine-generating enzyme required for sulfatase activity